METYGIFSSISKYPAKFNSWLVIENIPQTISDNELWKLLGVSDDPDVLKKKTICHSSDNFHKAAVLVYNKSVSASAALVSFTLEFSGSPFVALRISDVLLHVLREEAECTQLNRTLPNSLRIVSYKFSKPIDGYLDLFSAFGARRHLDAPANTLFCNSIVDAMAVVYALDNEKFEDATLRVERTFHNSLFMPRRQSSVIEFLMGKEISFLDENGERVERNDCGNGTNEESCPSGILNLERVYSSSISNQQMNHSSLMGPTYALNDFPLLNPLEIVALKQCRSDDISKSVISTTNEAPASSSNQFSDVPSSDESSSSLTSCPSDKIRTMENGLPMVSLPRRNRQTKRPSVKFTRSSYQDSSDVDSGIAEDIEECKENE